jgi:hypothetical protein
MSRKLASTRIKTSSLAIVRNAEAGLAYRGVSIRNSGESCSSCPVAGTWGVRGSQVEAR